MTLLITITITATAGDHFRADMPGGSVEASSLRELQRFTFGLHTRIIR
jgi:hypothetical protein